MIDNNSILIAYFSRRGKNYVNGDIVNLRFGNTEIVAHKLQKLTNGTMCRIESEFQYPEDYRQTTEQAKAEPRLGSGPL